MRSVQVRSKPLFKIVIPFATGDIITCNMQQTTIITDKTAFFLLGEIVEYGNTDDIFTSPRDERTERYITGRFG